MRCVSNSLKLINAQETFIPIHYSDLKNPSILHHYFWKWRTKNNCYISWDGYKPTCHSSIWMAQSNCTRRVSRLNCCVSGFCRLTLATSTGSFCMSSRCLRSFSHSLRNSVLRLYLRQKWYACRQHNALQHSTNLDIILYSCVNKVLSELEILEQLMVSWP